MKRLQSLFVFSLLLSAGMSWVLTSDKLAAQTLPLPDQLTSLTSPEGKQLLQDSESQADFIPLMSQFVTQINQAFCGIASTVMVLNALGVPAPAAPEWDQQYFTQDNLFNDRTEAVIVRPTVERQGLTLAELAGILSSYPVQVEVYYGSDISLEAFRERSATNLAEPNNYVLINYVRRAIGQERGGHISPIAAYDADTDQFLILDVSRYKYPPVWVQAETLWQAINTVDAVSGKTRGFLLIAAD